MEESTEASATLAEREGLVGKLCLPYALRGLLRWREGRIGEATVLFHRAHELAEQVGWSEIAFQALFGLAIALRDQGDLDGATAALDQAIEVCERAGLIAQSIQATGARAVILALAHRRQAAAEAAAMASQMAERLHYPIGRAAALEARGVSDEDPTAGAALLAEAEQAWRELDRPLEATRARLLAGQVLLGHDDERARELLDEAALRERAPRRAAPGREGARRRRAPPNDCTEGRRSRVESATATGPRRRSRPPWRRPRAPGSPASIGSRWPIAEALVHGARLAHVARSEEHDGLGPLLLLVGGVGHRAERGSRVTRPRRPPASRGPARWCRSAPRP